MGFGAAALVGAVAVTGSVAGAVISGNAAESAAKTQADAAKTAAADTMAMYNNNVQILSPFVNEGTTALPELQYLTGTGPAPAGMTQPTGLSSGYLTTPFTPTMSSLEQTPGYQFTLQQGEIAAQNSYAGQGLGSSGPAVVGGVNYASGLAASTELQQQQLYNQQQLQIANILQGQVNTGEAAGAQTAVVGANAQSSTNSLLTGAAAATAAGTVGAANAATGAIGSLSNTALLYGLLGNGGLFGASGASSP